MKMISALLVLLSIGSTLLASDFSAQCPEINFAEVTVSSFGNIVKNAASAASFDLILFLSIL